MQLNLKSFRNCGLVNPFMWGDLFRFSFISRSSFHYGDPSVGGVIGMYFGVVFYFFYKNAILFYFRPFDSLGKAGCDQFSRFVYFISAVHFTSGVTFEIEHKVKCNDAQGWVRNVKMVSFFDPFVFSSFLSSEIFSFYPSFYSYGFPSRAPLIGSFVDPFSEGITELSVLVSRPGAEVDYTEWERDRCVDFGNCVVLEKAYSFHLWELYFKGLGYYDFSKDGVEAVSFGSMDRLLLLFSFFEGSEFCHVCFTPFCEFNTDFLAKLSKKVDLFRVVNIPVYLDLFYLDYEGILRVRRGESKVRIQALSSYVFFCYEAFESQLLFAYLNDFEPVAMKGIFRFCGVGFRSFL